MPENVLAIDTESTKFRKSGGAIQEGQARVCQLALILSSPSGKILAEFNTLIKPDGWTISDGARGCHGITDEECRDSGMDFRRALEVYDEFATLSSLIVAHGEGFDRGMMEIETAYYKKDTMLIGIAEPRRPWFCTMTTNRHLNNGKNASLATCLQHYCGRSLGENAHNAIYDAEAAREIYFAMKGIKNV